MLKGLKIIGKIDITIGSHVDEMTRLRDKVSDICNGETLKMRSANISIEYTRKKDIKKVKLHAIRFTNRGIMLDLAWGSIHINSLSKTNLQHLVSNLRNLEAECLNPRQRHNSPFKSK